MKIELLVLGLAFVLMGCKTSKKNYAQTNHLLKYRKFNICGMYTNEFSRIKDSIKVEEIVKDVKNRKVDKSKIEQIVFAKSTVELLNVQRNYLDFGVTKYAYCEAKMLDSIIIVNFKHHSVYERSGVNGWGGGIYIQLKLFSDDFETRILSFSDAGGKVVEIPKKRIYYDKLELNKRNYEVGDTICGRLKFRNKLESGEFYIAKGSFKTIIEGETKMERMLRIQRKKRK